MKKIITLIGLQLFFLLLSVSQLQAVNDNAVKYVWKAGIARTVITPQSSIWMAGYSSRTSPSEGKLHDLWAKAVALEDAQGRRSILITMDLLGVPKDFSDEVRSRINRKYGLDYSQIILSSSHTHTG
ncbi:MAG: Uncharacterized protein XD92_1432, partial [Proteiniphilum acetatigenes]